MDISHAVHNFGAPVQLQLTLSSRFGTIIMIRYDLTAADIQAIQEEVAELKVRNLRSQQRLVPHGSYCVPMIIKTHWLACTPFAGLQISIYVGS